MEFLNFNLSHRCHIQNLNRKKNNKRFYQSRQMLNIEELKKKNKIGNKQKYQRETKMRYVIAPLNNRTY